MVNKHLNIGIIGLGTVGSGVIETLEKKNILGLKEDELKLIKEYIKKEEQVKSMRRNAARKQMVTLNKMKGEIRNFENVYGRFNKYMENQNIFISGVTQNNEQLIEWQISKI